MGTIDKRALAQYLSRNLDSYVWMKKLSERQLLAEINSLKVKPVFKTDQWIHQMVCFLVGMLEPRFLFLLDMGLGKSKIIQDLITQRIREKKIEHALITVPRLINIGSWQDDLLKHSNLESTPCIGEIEQKWERLLNPVGEVSLIDYAGLHLAVSRKLGKKYVRDDSKIAKLQKIYNFIGIDESHLVKNKDTLRFGIMRQLTKQADYVYSTTGTLFGRNIEAIWPQFYLVDRGDTFGDTLGLFRAGYMKETQDYWAGSTWSFDKRKARALYRALQHRSIRYDESECADLPECQYITIKVNMSKEQSEHYYRAVEGLISAGGKVQELDGAWIRMRQLVAGYLSWTDEYGPHEIRFKENAKLDALEKIVEESGDQKIVISHEYTVSGELIMERLKKINCKAEWLYGGSKDPVNAIRRFKNDPSIKVFLMNSASGGTGVDGMQDVANYMVFYESPPSPIARKQTEKRVHRPGQTHKTFIYDLMASRTVDFGIKEMLAEGKSMHDMVVGGQFKREHLGLLNQ